MPELPYTLPDHTVVRTVEDLEVGVQRAIVGQRAAQWHQKPTEPWGAAIRDLSTLLRINGQKYDKWRAHTLLARASAMLADDGDPDRAALAIEIEAYLQPRLARHADAREVRRG